MVENIIGSGGREAGAGDAEPGLGGVLLEVRARRGEGARRRWQPRQRSVENRVESRVSGLESGLFSKVVP